MSASDNQLVATPAAAFTKTWRYKTGFTMIVVGNLKECVYGQMHDFIFPEWTDEYETIVTPDLKQYVKDNAGKRRSEFDPEGHAKSVAQQEATVKILEDLGVVVHRPEKLTPEQEQYYPLSSVI